MAAEKANQKEVAPESTLVINFAAIGSSEFGIHTSNVTPAQILCAAAWLEWYAKRLFDSQANHVDQAMQKKIVVPGMSIPVRLGQ